MNKNSSGTTWGVMLILIGIVIGGKALDWFDFDLFFNGWWTLFIIIPSAVKFFTEKGKRSSALKGLCLGLLLLMAAQGFIEISMFLPLLLAVFFVLTGMKMISPGRKEEDKRADDRRRSSRQPDNRRAENGPRERRRMYGEDYVDAAQYSYKDEYDSSLFGEESPKEAFRQEQEENRKEAFRQEQEENWKEASSQEQQEDSLEDGPWGFEWNQYADRRQYRRGYQEPGRGQARREYENPPRYQAGYQDTRNTGRRNGHCACTAILSGKEINFSHEVFNGAMLSCILGSIDLNLSDGIFYQDTVIEARTFLGGIEITVPQNVRVMLKGTPIFGAVENHIKRNAPLPPDALTIYVNATCVLGGVEIKTKKTGK